MTYIYRIDSDFIVFHEKKKTQDPIGLDRKKVPEVRDEHILVFK